VWEKSYNEFGLSLAWGKRSQFAPVRPTRGIRNSQSYAGYIPLALMGIVFFLAASVQYGVKCRFVPDAYGCPVNLLFDGGCLWM
jgi:hypothetical protein